MENSRHNIKINPPEPSSEQIRSKMDFDSVLQNFQAPSASSSGSWASGKTYLGLGALVTGMAVIALLFVAPNLFNLSAGSNGDEFRPAAFVDPPIKELQKKFTSYKVNANKGGIFKYGDSKLTVPPAAFLDENGNPVQGEITLKYREYHDYIDFFLSGIPMEYDSAGTNYLFESAGMMEIRATQDGKEVQLAPDKPIDVQLASTLTFRDKIPDYNIYELDTTNRSWTYITTDRIDLVEEDESFLEVETTPLSEPEQRLQQINKEIKSLDNPKPLALAIEESTPVPPKPVAPQAANEDDHVLNFDVDISEFPEMAGYKNVLWKLNEEYKPGWFKIEWEDIELKKLSGENKYQAVLRRGKEQVQIAVSPVLKGRDLAKALAEFEAQNLAYKAALDQRQEQLRIAEAKRQEETEERRIELEARKLKFEAQVAKYKEMGMDRQLTEQLTEKRVVNNFRVTSLGFWNCDRPLPPFRTMLFANFKKEDGADYFGNKVYLADKSRNTVGSMLAKKKNQLNFDSRSENIMWLVTKDGQLAIFDQNRFKQVGKVDNYDFAMKLHPKVVDSEEEIRAILKFN